MQGLRWSLVQIKVCSAHLSFFSRLKFREKSRFGPGVVGALVRCALEGVPPQENPGAGTTTRGKRLSTVHTLPLPFSLDRLEAQAFVQKLDLGNGHLKPGRWDKTEHQAFLKGLVSRG